MNGRESYLMVDLRHAPGPSEEQMRATGHDFLATRGTYEAATYTCSHCSAVVVMNPERRRDRAWCRKCDHIVCEPCGYLVAMTGTCFPMAQRLEEGRTAAERRLVAGRI